MSTHERRFSGDEIETIFRRATERQKAQDRNASDGLTLDELKAVAVETGLDPEHVAAAASEVARGYDSTPPPLSFVERLYGTSASIRVVRTIPGRVDDATWTDVVEVLRSTFETRGRTEQVGTMREWVGAAAPRSTWSWETATQGSFSATWSGVSGTPTDANGAPRATLGTPPNLVHVEVAPHADGTKVSAWYEMRRSDLWEPPFVLLSGLGGATAIALLFAFGAFATTPWIIPVLIALAGVLGFVQQFKAKRDEIEGTRRRIQTALDRIEGVHVGAAPSPQPAAHRSEERLTVDEEVSDATPSLGSSPRTRETHS